MSAENKALVRRYFETIDSGDLSGLDGLIAPAFVRHDPNAPEVKGLEDLKRHLQRVYSAFPDFRHIIEDMIAEGDRVATRLMACGTHKGELMGVAPTGKQISVTGMRFCRITNGKIQEDWHNSDTLGLLQQLGIVPK
jgi:steroid delta-isomerase-like uncharacterized protein